MRKSTILAVDDDAGLQTVLKHYFEQEGYNYLSAYNGKELTDKLEKETLDIILLDLIFPHEDGLTLLSTIRKKSKAAIIVISGKKEAVDKIIGLEMGADDYLAKPFELRELSARIKSVLRRTKPNSDAEIIVPSQLAKSNRIFFNDWILDKLQYQLFDSQGNPTKLTSGEYKLLEALLIRPHRVLSRAYLFEITRDSHSETFDRAIDIQIGRLRKKMNDDPKNPSLIKTVRGVGYIFIGDPKSTDEFNYKLL